MLGENKNKKSKKILKILIIGVIAIALQMVLNINYKVMATTNTNTSTVNSSKISIKKLKYKINTSVHTYTGGERKPYVKLYNKGKRLKENRDYTVTYKNNINTGKATIIVQGKGKYTGTIKKYFYIAPKKAIINSVMFNAKFTNATITWEKDSQASGYAIYMSESKDGEYTKIKNITSKKITTYTKKGLDSDKMYYFKIRSFRTINGKRVYSKKYSNPKSNTGLLAEVTLTSSSSGTNRNYNLSLASKKMNGTVLKPGETFNWFNVVGSASKAKGYKLAIIFENGKSVNGYGGGVCQVSTTLYQASLKAGLKIVERHTHSKPVSYTSSGKDATVAYGSKNLRIKNNKEYSIKLVTTSNKGSTTCKIYRIAD